jgi:hypothetical protein
MRRRIRLLVLLLLGGLVISVLVAWSAEVTIDSAQPVNGIMPLAEDLDDVMGPLWEERPRPELLWVRSGYSFFQEHGWGLTRSTQFASAASLDYLVMNRVQTGWPFHCVERRHWLVEGASKLEAVNRGTIFLPYRSFMVNGEIVTTPRRIGVIPMWPGLLANTALYALLLFVLFGGIGAGRRASRRVRGRCEGCGYPLRSLPTPVCPECGRSSAVESSHAQPVH